MEKYINRLFAIILFSFLCPLNLKVVTPWGPIINEEIVLQIENLIFLQEFFEGDTIKVQKYLSLVDSSVKKIVLVSILKQELIVLDFADTFKVDLKTKISSGRATPRGEFEILEKRYSRPSYKYGGLMTYWNCITNDERFGIHGLRDKSYEANLGKPVSHGCIRISSTIAPIFYALCPVGTPVFIE